MMFLATCNKYKEPMKAGKGRKEKEIKMELEGLDLAKH